MVSPHYHPMLAKVIAHGATRDEACRRLARALADQAARRAAAPVLATLPSDWRNMPNELQHAVFAHGDDQIEVRYAFVSVLGCYGPRERSRAARIEVDGWRSTVWWYGGRPGRWWTSTWPGCGGRPGCTGSGRIRRAGSDCACSGQSGAMSTGSCCVARSSEQLASAGHRQPASTAAAEPGRDCQLRPPAGRLMGSHRAGPGPNHHRSRLRCVVVRGHGPGRRRAARRGSGGVSR